MVPVGALAALVACAPSEGVGPPPEPERRPSISEDRARTLAAERYRHLFENRYFRDPRDGSYHVFEPLEAKEFQVRDDGEAWLVARDGLRGFIVHARVAKNGSWVDLTQVGYAIR
jgi:hypothetical protein